MNRRSFLTILGISSISSLGVLKVLEASSEDILSTTVINPEIEWPAVTAERIACGSITADRIAAGTLCIASIDHLEGQIIR